MKSAKEGRNDICILRKLKLREYTQIDNDVLNDKTLSWKAKGILCYMISRPDNWEFSLTEVCKHSTDGWTSFRSGVEELLKRGHLFHRVYADKDNNGYIKNEYIVSERPLCGNPNTDIPFSDMQKLLRRSITKTEIGLDNTLKSINKPKTTKGRQPHFVLPEKASFSDKMGLKLYHLLKLKSKYHYAKPSSYTKQVEKLRREGVDADKIVTVFKWYDKYHTNSKCPQIFKVSDLWTRFGQIERARIKYLIDAGEADEDSGEPIVARRNVLGTRKHK